MVVMVVFSSREDGDNTYHNAHKAFPPSESSALLRWRFLKAHAEDIGPHSLSTICTLWQNLFETERRFLMWFAPSITVHFSTTRGYHGQGREPEEDDAVVVVRKIRLAYPIAPSNGLV
jgi:hypothetical protein